MSNQCVEVDEITGELLMTNYSNPLEIGTHTTCPHP